MIDTWAWHRAGAVFVVILIIGTVVPFAIFAVPQVVGADESYVVLSGSMEPALAPGDVVIVDASKPIQVGDIVTFGAGSESIPTTHRVVSITETGYETKGDANENPDPGLIPPESVLGRVVLVIPLIGHVILWTNTPVGFVFLIVVPVTALVLNELRSWSGGSDDGEGMTGQSPSSATAPGTDIDPELTPETPSKDLVTIGFLDLKLTLLAMGALFAYAAWTAFREILAVSAPHPVTIGVLTGGLLGVVVTGWISIGSWRANRSPGPDHRATTAARTDGSGRTEESND